MKTRISKEELIEDIDLAIRENKGYALGKIGFSEQYLLGYLPFLQSNPGPLQVRAYEALLRFHCEKQFGLFPANREFLLRFLSEYKEHLRRLNVLGLFIAPQEEKIIKEYRLQSKLIHYRFMEPDQSIPENPALCYLPSFKGKKILLLAPFANLLKERATAEIYEKVWRNVGKRWFLPSGVSAIEFPYSYITETKTHEAFGNSLELYKSICDRINKEEFDIALIAAGALAIPLASYVKSMGKVAFSLGGHLQVIFGIAGKRWKYNPHYKQNYLNEFWTDMPESYHPKNKEILTDSGSYW